MRVIWVRTEPPLDENPSDSDRGAGHDWNVRFAAPHTDLPRLNFLLDDPLGPD
jgi:hypothetical protein